MTSTITKSDFLQFRESPIHFWAACHDEQTSRSFNEFQQHLAAQGRETERMAYTYLDSVVLPTYEDAELIWQAEYTDGLFYAKLDGLIHDKIRNTYDLYEIKASTKPDKHLEDIAFQTLVCEANIRINHAYLLHLNKDYLRSGDLQLADLFVCTKMDEDIAGVRDEIMTAREACVRSSQLQDPHNLEPCYKPKDCPCRHLCHPDLPAYPIYDVPRISKDKLNTLRSAGILSIHDIPNDIELSEKQQAVVDVIRSQQPAIDRRSICESLSEIAYPIAFLDYEAALTAIPAYDGYHPNENLAFQYSLHVIETSGADALHYEFLGDGYGDPARHLVAHLSQHMPQAGSVVVWNKTYEQGINTLLGRSYPEYEAFTQNMNARIYDLMNIFRDGHYHHPDFRGSYSIKAILPVLVPQLSYAGMPVAHGGQAVHTWNLLTAPEISTSEKQQLRTELLAYCRLDTLAMVEIWRELQSLC